MNKLNQKTKTVTTSYDKIIKTAIEEFAVHGFAGARIDRIAKSASVNKAMIYYHFSSKLNLYLEVVKQLINQASRHTHPALPLSCASQFDSLAIEELFTSMAARYQSIFQSSPQLRALILRELANPHTEILDRIAEVLGGGNFWAVILKAIKTGQERGEIRPVDPRQIIVSFVAINVGYFFLAPITDRIFNIADRGEFIRQRQKAVVDLIMNGIKIK